MSRSTTTRWGNVSAVTTILPAGTDHQLFCYDAQNRLTWAGTTTGNPCNNPGATGTFGTAGYTETFSYDTLNGLTNSPLGNYTYGDSAHPHAVTSVSGGTGAYSASYDAAGDMQCRAPSSATTCSGTPTGQALAWDVEGRISNWQNATTSPTVTAKYLYDGEGQRVVQQVVDSTAGSTTTTSYVGSLETYSITTGNQPTNITTTDYLAAGKVLAESVNGTLSYLATTYQGSVAEALDSTGNVGVTASQLYVPYGGIRYANGSLPTDYGYTGQRRDASSGLDYYGARYYDPVVGQFTSADTLLAGGLNRYGYVGGNPTTATDPSGHMLCSDVASTSCQGVPPPRPGYRVRYPVIKIKCLIRCNQSPENGGAGTPNASYGSGNGGRGAPISVNAEHDVLWFDGLWFGGYGAYVGATRGYYKSLAKSLSQDAWDTYSYINKRGSPVDVDFKSGRRLAHPMKFRQPND